jgi:hypothetical protein
MSPKIILWISFSVISSTWYALDPDARLASGFSVADNATTQMEQMILTESLEVRTRTAMN